MAEYFSDQKVRPAGGRRAPRSSELKSQAANKIIRFLSGDQKRKPKSNRKFRHFASLSYEDKVKFLKKKLYRLYDQKLDAEEAGIETDLVDNKIARLEQQIQEIQFEMYE